MSGPGGAAEQARVLLVDDEEEVLQGLALALRGRGYQLRFATSAAAALDLLAREPVDVVVTDYQMPGTDGLELLRQVTDRFPDTARLMLTGRAELTVAVDAINEGLIHRFLKKPCSGLDLGLAIYSACEHLALERENRRLAEAVRSDPALRARLEALPERRAPALLQPLGAAAAPQEGQDPTCPLPLQHRHKA